MGGLFTETLVEPLTISNRIANLQELVTQTKKMIS